jgi:DNA-binding response OmpR family regulator
MVALASAAVRCDVRQRRILIVDDDLDTAELFGTLLTIHGHRCKWTGTGSDALAQAAEFCPHIVLVDLSLPDISGYDVARRLRAHAGPSIYLAAVTGWSSPDYRRRACDAGFDQHIVKPVDSETLRNLVRNAV